MTTFTLKQGYFSSTLRPDTLALVFCFLHRYTFYWWNVAQLATMRKVNATRRFFSINRAWTPGTARLGAVAWTGDINPQWGDLVNTPGMVLNWGLAGIPYVACDIGGFTSQSQPDLLARWFQVGVFMPIMRVHSTKSATPHFPWLWGPAYAAAMKGALNLRYQLVPYHYSLAHHMRAPSGKLWMRSMVAEYPHDATSAPLTSQWFDGDILVAPILKQDSTKQVYLPNGTWFTFSANGTGTGATVQGPTTVTGAAAIDEIPMYVRPGTVVPVGPVVQYTGALPGGPLRVQVYTGKDATFTLMEDDGATTAYEAGGAAVRKTTLTWDEGKKTLSWVVEGSGSNSANNFQQLYAVFYVAGGASMPTPSKTVAIGTSGSIVSA